MMEENNDIFLDGVYALVYLANQRTKNIPQHLFEVIHLIRTYLMTDFSTLSLCTNLYPFWMTPTPPFLQLRTYLMDGLFLNQKTIKNIRISYSLKYKLWEKSCLRKNKWQCRMKQIFRGAVLIKKPILKCQLCFCKEKFLLRIVSFDTVGLHLLTFHILELYPSKDILALMALVQYSLSLV